MLSFASSQVDVCTWTYLWNSPVIESMVLEVDVTHTHQLNCSPLKCWVLWDIPASWKLSLSLIEVKSWNFEMFCRREKLKNVSGGNIRQISWNTAFQCGVKLCHGCHAASPNKLKNIFHPALLCSVLLAVQWEEKRTAGHEGRQQILILSYTETFFYGTYQDRTPSEKYQNTSLYNAIFRVV